jgi:GxxExxY protein
MQVYEAAREVHEQYGIGIPVDLLKSCLAHELRIRGLRCQASPDFHVVYNDIKLDHTLKTDILIEETLAPILFKNNEQAIDEMANLLSLSQIPVGLAIEIDKNRFIDGFKKIQNSNNNRYEYH